jgi:hypothetical protein
MFAIVTVLAILGLWLGLAFRRFGARAAERPAEGTNEPGPGGFSRWFFRRVAESLRKPGRDALADRLRSPALRRAPVLEKWLLAGLYATFLFLAASGFFFAIFIERGLFGITLLLHFTAGVVFAVCLALTAILKAGRYIPNPGPLSLPAFSGDLPSGRGIGKVTKVSIPDRDIISGLFWVFVLAGFSLTVSALLPMLPWFHHQGQVILFAWHRWSALAALLAAIAFADLEFFPRRPAA